MTQSKGPLRVRMDLRDDAPAVAAAGRVDVERLRMTAALGGRAYRKWLSLSRLAGVALMLVGAAYSAAGFIPGLERGQSDNRERVAWQEAVAAPLPVEVASKDRVAPVMRQPTTSVPSGGGASVALPSGAYALLNLPSVHESVVMGDGGWDVLNHRSAVHWHDSPAPGSEGNVVVAFHREPLFKDVGMLRAGDFFEVQVGSGKVFRYRVTKTRIVRRGPQGWDTSDLDPVHGAKVATLITCDPFYQDYQRILIRGELV